MLVCGCHCVWCVCVVCMWCVCVCVWVCVLRIGSTDKIMHFINTLVTVSYTHLTLPTKVNV